MVNKQFEFYLDTLDEFYCEDGSTGKCDRDCHDCDIYSEWWKEWQ